MDLDLAIVVIIFGFLIFQRDFLSRPIFTIVKAGFGISHHLISVFPFPSAICMAYWSSIQTYGVGEV